MGINAVTPYGFHRDELLYLAMGRHLRLWRMDFPPAIALAAEGDPRHAGRLAPGHPPRAGPRWGGARRAREPALPSVDLAIYVARGPRRTLQDVWPGLAGIN